MENNEINKKNIKYGIILSYISYAIAFVCSLLLQKILISSLGDVQYGLSSFVTSITSWLSLLSFGLASTYIRFATLSYKNGGDIGLKKNNGMYILIFAIISLISLIIGFVLLLLFRIGIIPLQQYSIEEKEIIYALLVVSVVNVSTSFLFNIFTLFLNYKTRFIWLRIIDILSKIFICVATFFAVKMGCNIVAAIGIQLLATLLVSLINLIYCLAKLHFSFSLKLKGYFKQNVRSMVFYSFFIFINIIINQINNSFGKIFLGFADGAVSVTIYTVGITFYSYLNEMTSAISVVFTPKVHYLVAHDEHESVQKMFINVSKAQAIITVFLFTGFLIAGREFIICWLGTEKTLSYYVSVMLLFAAIVPFSQNLGIEVQRAYNKHQFRSIFYLIAAFINILLTFILSKVLNGEYVVFAPALALFSSLIISTWVAMNIFYSKVLKLPVLEYWKNLLELSIIAITSYCLTYGTIRVLDLNVSYLVLFLTKAGIFTIVFVATLFIIKRKEIKELFKLFKR